MTTLLIVAWLMFTPGIPIPTVGQTAGMLVWLLFVAAWYGISVLLADDRICDPTEISRGH